MVKSRFGYRTPIPGISSSKGQTKSLSYKDGVQTYADNDDVKLTEVVTANDARFVKIGRYKTRKGLDRYSVPVGEAVDVEVVSTTGAADKDVDGISQAQKLTVGSSGSITRVDVRLKTTDASQGVLLVEVYENTGGLPGRLLCRSSIAPSSVSSSYAYIPAYFAAAPSVTSGDNVIVAVRPQSESVGRFNVSSTTSSSNALTSNDGGSTWAPAAYSINVKLYTATSGGVKGLIRAYRPNGLKLTMFAHSNSVLSVNDTTGATTALKSDFSPSGTNYRSKMVQDATYWVNGAEKPWKYDFSAWTQLATPYTPSLIEEHKGLLFFNDVDDPTRIFYSNFAEYDTYTSTDFIYVPAPKSADPVVAFAKLNGVLYPFTRRNKFQLFGSDNATWSLDEAASQRGTFSQETCVYDANSIFHADDDGIWQFNGSEENNLALPFLADYQAIPDKSSMRLDLFNNRLYCFYTPVGGDVNSECYVMNLQLDVFESIDTGTYVGRTFGRESQEDTFIQASNRVGAVYYGELEGNDHSNMGDQLQFKVHTSYSHFDRPGELKRIPKFRPQFPSQEGYYSVQVGFDRDSEQNPTFVDVPVTGTGPRYNTGVLYNSGAHYSGQRMITPTTVNIPGTFRRVQRRFEHVAAREPVELDSEILTIETQRLT